MHEFSLMSSVLTTALTAASECNALKITSIKLTIGQLSEVLPDAMYFAHEALTAGTIAEGSTLSMTMVEARSRCLQCGHEYIHDRFKRSCPNCDSLACELLTGRELEITSIEVENAD